MLGIHPFTIHDVSMPKHLIQTVFTDGLLYVKDKVIITAEIVTRHREEFHTSIYRYN